ncbi:hypothetical protein OBBRIDRAFT_311054 [Obba rivulosa]|uniref:Uncharacterized protein n=1 Tax=Obba rivulosa TaxID=1052685 RepID=A0A8E2DH44_9APHY|nr:hypothetical protein OBBRIDRAFT_311054 [Obba rivulosa]
MEADGLTLGGRPIIHAGRRSSRGPNSVYLPIARSSIFTNLFLRFHLTIFDTTLYTPLLKNSAQGQIIKWLLVAIISVMAITLDAATDVALPIQPRYDHYILLHQYGAGGWVSTLINLFTATLIAVQHVHALPGLRSVSVPLVGNAALANNYIHLRETSFMVTEISGLDDI